MALRINNPEADSLARELARTTGESITQAVILALRERLEREQGRQQPSLAEELVRIGKECAALPVLDGRTADELLGYDEEGLPWQA
jgi:antitoxin VapB